MADSDLVISVVISTYNRASAIPATLDALAQQDLPGEDFEVLVVDDGSTDETQEVLSAAMVPYALRTFRLPTNRGVSAGRNVGLRNAAGEYVVMISDDLIVPARFLTEHLATLRRFPDAWVVGGFRQLDSLRETPFGRYLEQLELGFDRARLTRQIDQNLFEMDWPTARNLSLPRRHLQRIGLFDEQFRVTCEDQDLAQRAREQGIHFVYDASLECIHNDQAADLARYCRFQERGARDTVRLCRKYPVLHGGAAVIRSNGHVTRTDSPRTVAKKLIKGLLSRPSMVRALLTGVTLMESMPVPEIWVQRLYSVVIGAHIFRGIRQGLLEQANS